MEGRGSPRGARGDGCGYEASAGVEVSLALVPRHVAVSRADGILYPSVLERTAHVPVAKKLEFHPRVLDMHRVEDLFEAVDDPLFGELSPGIPKLVRGPAVG